MMTRQEERQYQELQEAFARLKPKFEELWVRDAIYEVKVELQEHEIRTDVVKDCMDRCYQHLAEAYWTIWTEVDRHHPGLHAHKVRWLLHDSTVVSFDVDDGWSFCRVRMRANVQWPRVFQRYCQEEGITHKYDVVGYISPCQH